MTAECSVDWGAEHFVAGGAESFVTEDADCSAAGGTEYFVGTFLVVPSAYHHTNLPCAPPHSCKWGNTVPMSTFLQSALASP